MFAGDFAPRDWALCEGQILPINGNEVLYALLGTVYGGNGQTTFALPDLRGRVPIHTSMEYPVGAAGGTETVTLTVLEMPAHTHDAYAVKERGQERTGRGALWSGSQNYSDGKDSDNKPIPPVYMDPRILSLAGGREPHNNMMPSLAVSFIIALRGMYPPQP